MSTFKGSCLCGQVTYKIEGETMVFAHCHCQRYRKSSGTGHTSNIRVDADKVSWTSGEALVKSYKVPDAERFKNVFCSECGSSLPRHFPSYGFIILPAGTLDSELDILPQARIFYASKADWSCSDELPTHDEYPG